VDNLWIWQRREWKYVLVPHDAVAANMTLKGLEQNYGVR